MRVSVFGLGYVGTVCAACLADQGHDVIGVDKSEGKVGLISAGRSPIVERDIDDVVLRSVRAGRLRATCDASTAVASSEISLVCVGTPSRPNGSIDLSAVEAVAGEIGEAIRAKAEPHAVVIRSTVTPRMTRQIIAPRLAAAAGNMAFSLAFNPEFLREGSAVADFKTPSKTVVGTFDDETADMVMSLYRDLPGPKITTDVETAELVKYVDNAWHALKVAFGNEIGLIAKTLGINSHAVMDIFLQDKRLNVSPAYLRPGFAFGGSCLPKDLRAITHMGRTLDLQLPVLNHVLDSNRMLIERGAEWILSHSGERIAFLGISFKSGTDDVRESSFVELVERLVGKGRKVRIFDSNVRPAELVGANREYLMRAFPHIVDLMVPEIADAVDWAQTIVTTVTDPVYEVGMARVRPDQTVLDFARFDARYLPENSQGFLW
jgi:GDP-mannose 6-dehydrogenase